MAMNWDAIGAIGTILGSVAVVATLIYLARQLHESSLLGKSTMSNAIAQSYAELAELIVANPSVAALIARLKSADAELSEADQVQVQMLAYRYVNIFIQGQEAYDHGHLKRENLLGIKASLRDMVERYPGLEPHVRSAVKTLQSLSHYEVFDYFEGKP